MAVCTTLTITAAAPTVSAADVGFSKTTDEPPADCKMVEDAAGKLHIRAKVTANKKLKADVTLGWKKGADTFAKTWTNVTFDEGTWVWAFSTDKAFSPGTYTSPNLAFGSPTALGIPNNNNNNGNRNRAGWRI